MLTALKSNRLISILWLLALSVYVLAGVPIVSFHGDEAMQIWMSHDYATAFIYGEPVRLMSDGPFDGDSEAQLRLLNGSVNRYGIGLGWHLAGFTNGDLPPQAGWNWGEDYDRNIARGNRSPDDLLHASRMSSAVFLALSVWVMFGIGSQLGGPLVGYIASGLYAVNPAILINGRRAMMEGSLLLFGLLTILVAVSIARRRAEGRRGLWGWWLALVVCGSLAVASKHSGLVFVGGALGWIFLSELIGRRWRELPVMVAKLAVSGVLIIAGFIALSPAFWYDPVARLDDLIEQRSTLIEIQVRGDATAPMDTAQRIEQILVQPYLRPPAHFEVGSWTDFSVITEEIQRYMNSPLSGLQFGPVLGGLLMLLVVVGMFAALRYDAAVRAGIFVWLLATLAMLMINPLPWQRYYLPLIPIYTLFSSLGAGLLLARFVARPEQHPTNDPLVSEAVQAQTGR